MRSPNHIDPSRNPKNHFEESTDPSLERNEYWGRTEMFRLDPYSNELNDWYTQQRQAHHFDRSLEPR